MEWEIGFSLIEYSNFGTLGANHRFDSFFVIIFFYGSFLNQNMLTMYVCLLNCTTCRMYDDHHGDIHLKESSFLVDSVVYGSSFVLRPEWT